MNLLLDVMGTTMNFSMSGKDVIYDEGINFILDELDGRHIESIMFVSYGFVSEQIVDEFLADWGDVMAHAFGVSRDMVFAANWNYFTARRAGNKREAYIKFAAGGGEFMAFDDDFYTPVEYAEGLTMIRMPVEFRQPLPFFD